MKFKLFQHEGFEEMHEEHEESWISLRGFVTGFGS